MAIGRTNAGGGGGRLTKSVIVVTAPTGSTVTCTKGNVVKKAEEKSGTWIFAGLDVGTWTASGVKDSMSASQTVEITTEAQGVIVSLTYDMILYRKGTKYVDFTEGKGSNAKGGASWGTEYVRLTSTSGDTWGGTRSIYTSAAIDLTPYSKLRVKMANLSGIGGRWVGLAVCQYAPAYPYNAGDNYLPTNAIASIKLTSITDNAYADLDISAVTVPCYVSVQVATPNTQNNTAYVDVYDVYLER